MLLDSIIPVERNVLAFRTTLDKLRQLGTDFDSMLFSICPNGFLVFNTSIWYSKNGGITAFVQTRLRIVSYLVVLSYISSSCSLVATRVVDIAKKVLFKSGTLVEQGNSARVSMLEHQQQGGLRRWSDINMVLDSVIGVEATHCTSRSTLDW
jgi:hypothetical protein